MIKKYDQFVNEAKSSKKEEAKAQLLKMFKSNPKVKAKDKTKGWCDRKNVYDMAAMATYMEDKGYTSNQSDTAFQDLKKEKDLKFNHIKIKNFHFNESFPYYYLESEVTKDQANEAKVKMEEESKTASADKIAKRKEAAATAKKNTKGSKK